MVRELGGGYDMAGGCFTNMCYIVLKPITRRVPPKDVVTAWGTIFYVATELPMCTNSNRWFMCSKQGTWAWSGNFWEAVCFLEIRG